jgi:hypothetical protein
LAEGLTDGVDADADAEGPNEGTAAGELVELEALQPATRARIASHERIGF